MDLVGPDNFDRDGPGTVDIERNFNTHGNLDGDIVWSVNRDSALERPWHRDINVLWDGVWFGDFVVLWYTNRNGAGDRDANSEGHGVRDFNINRNLDRNIVWGIDRDTDGNRDTNRHRDLNRPPDLDRNFDGYRNVHGNLIRDFVSGRERSGHRNLEGDIVGHIHLVWYIYLNRNRLGHWNRDFNINRDRDSPWDSNLNRDSHGDWPGNLHWHIDWSCVSAAWNRDLDVGTADNGSRYNACGISDDSAVNAGNTAAVHATVHTSGTKTPVSKATTV